MPSLAHSEDEKTDEKLGAIWKRGKKNHWGGKGTKLKTFQLETNIRDSP